MDLLGGRWKLGILYSLRVDGRARFTQLQKRMDGITPSTLTRQLRELERDGLVTRTQYNEIPPRVEYDTTELLTTLLPILDEIVSWVDTHYGTVEANRTTQHTPD